MPRKKMLVLSDSPAGRTGLGKITAALAFRINQMPEFEVATLGTGVLTSRHLPFQQYLCGPPHPSGVSNLPQCWRDFAGDEHGILLSIWNPGWLAWLSDPAVLPPGELKTFLESKPFERWGYFPVDAEGPNHRLPWDFATIIKGFDRILSYTKWQADMTEQTLAQPPFNRPGENHYLPHGIDESVFYPRDREIARQQMLLKVTKQIDKPIQKNVLLVSCIATNTPRKDWGLVFEVCGELLKRGVQVGLWAHTDQLKGKNWNLEALTAEYDLQGMVIPTTGDLSDEDIAWALSASDVSIGPGLGEGFGLPIAQSLAVGTPVVTANYAGVTEFVPEQMRIDPIGFFNDGPFCQKRPVFRITDWADRIEQVVRLRTGESLLSHEFSWEKLWPRWAAWLLEELK